MKFMVLLEETQPLNINIFCLSSVLLANNIIYFADHPAECGLKPRKPSFGMSYGGK
jgi:hypothetical protein